MPSRNVFRLQNSKIQDNRPETHTKRSNITNSHKQNLEKKNNAKKIQYNFGIDQDEKLKHVKGLSLLNLPNDVDGCGSKDVIEELYKEGEVTTFSSKTSDLSITTSDNIINKKIVNLVSENIILESTNVYPDRISDCQVFYLETIYDESSDDEAEIDHVVTSSIKRYYQPAIQDYKKGRFLLDRVLIRKQIQSNSNTSCSSTNDDPCSQDSLNDDFGPANFSSSGNVCISYSDSRSTNCSCLSIRDSPYRSNISDNDDHCYDRISKEKQALIESFNVKSDEDICTLKEFCDQYDLIYVPKHKCPRDNFSEVSNCNKKFGGGLGYKLRCFKNKSKFPPIPEQPSKVSCQLSPILHSDKKEKKKGVFSKLFSKVKKEPSKKECKCPDPGKDVKEIKNIKDDKNRKHIEDIEDCENVKYIKDVDDNKHVRNVKFFSDVQQVDQIERKEYKDKDVSISGTNLSSENKTQTCITNAGDKCNCTEIPHVHEATATESKQLINIGVRTSTPSLLDKKPTKEQSTNLSSSTECKTQESQTLATLCYENLESPLSCNSTKPVLMDYNKCHSCTRGVQYREPKVTKTKYPCESNDKPKYKCPYCDDCNDTSHFLDSTNSDNKINNCIREKKLKRRKRDHHREDKCLVSDELSTEPTNQTKVSCTNLLSGLKPTCKSNAKSPHKERCVCKPKTTDQEECACLRKASNHDICKYKLKTSNTSKYKHNTPDKKLTPKETEYTAKKIPVNNSTTSLNSEMCKPKTHEFKENDQDFEESKDKSKTHHESEKSKLKTLYPTIYKCKPKSKHLMCNCADFSCQSTEEKKEYSSQEVSCIEPIIKCSAQNTCPSLKDADSNNSKPKPSDETTKTVTTHDKEISCSMVQKQKECISQEVDCTVPEVKKCSIEVSCSSLLNMFKNLVVDTNKSNKVDVGTSRTRSKSRKSNKAVTCREVKNAMVCTDFDTEPTDTCSKITEKAKCGCNELEKTEVDCQLQSIKEMISKGSSSEPTTKNCSVEVSCTNLLSQFVKECLEKALREENDTSKNRKDNYMQTSTVEQRFGESHPRGSCLRNPYTRDPCYRDPYPAYLYPYPTNLYSSEVYPNELCPKVQCSRSPHLTQTPYTELYYQTTNRRPYCKEPYMESLPEESYLQNPCHLLDNSGAETNADVIESDDIARSDFTTAQPNKEEESIKCRDCNELCSGINAFFHVLGCIIGKGDYPQEEVEVAKENKCNRHCRYDKWKTYNQQGSKSSSTVDDTNKMNCEFLQNFLSEMRDESESDYDQLESRIKNLDRALQNTMIQPYLSFLKNQKQQELEFEKKRFNKMKVRPSDERQLHQPRQNKVRVCQIRRTEVSNGLRRHNVINVCDISKLNTNRFRNCEPQPRTPPEPEQNYYYNPFIPKPTIPTVKCTITDHSKHPNYYYGETNTTPMCTSRRKCNINTCPYQKIRPEKPMERSVCSHETAPTSVSKNVRDAITKLKSATRKRYKTTLFQKIRGEIPPEQVIAPTHDVISISTSDNGHEKKPPNYNYGETKPKPRPKQKCSYRNKCCKNTSCRKIDTEIPTKLTNLPTREVTSISTFENMCPFSSCSFCKERGMCSTSTSGQSGNSKYTYKGSTSDTDVSKCT